MYNLPRYYRLDIRILKKSNKLYILYHNIRYYISLRSLRENRFEREYIRNGFKPIYGFDAELCDKKYCIDCGGYYWRDRNLIIKQTNENL